MVDQLCTLPKYDFDVKVDNVLLNNYLNHIEEKYISKDGILNLKEEKLKPVLHLLLQKKDVINDLKNLKELLQDDDNDLKQLAETERQVLEEKLRAIGNEIIKALLAMHGEHQCNAIILEVNAGVGGQEAMMFASELFNMYVHFSEYKGWTFEVTEYTATDIEGCRHACAMIEGDSVYNNLIHEAGVHRVQRIPITEKSGRIHTSTASVLILPQPNEIQIQINNSDLKIETKRATGAGGQHVNTTDSAVRITHLPTGISTECQIDRSQIKNRRIAMQKLRTLLYNQQLDKQLAEIEKTKKTQVKSNFRNERIRTYNFSQDRITDHRLQGCNYHNIKAFLGGGEQLESLITKLDNSNKLQRLLETIDKFKTS
ncbi:peptide chain release factor 1-like, mitochondrial [Agrilus planipennis]|uniref:Peptide chain release factor 1-like, mitochondrial n=1 Tax=Agrilus planipennis TaxID=224129 RepID=A0A1W4WHC9_AGRPL|nr:peptide chain release factor 1-like, mitochondrial [Agrilus planipennis]